MKRAFCAILGTIMALGSLSALAACSDNRLSVSADGYTLSVESTDGGYSVSVEKNGVRYSTDAAALGIRFDRNSFRADDPVYAAYSAVELKNGMLVGTGSVASEYGSKISFEDWWSVAGGKVNVDRQFTVTKAGEDNGFMTELKLRDAQEGSVVDSDWFVPSTHYITGEHDFSQTSTRMYFSGTDLVIPADDVSVLSASRYADGKSFTMLDTTPGYRENIIEDRESSSTVLYIDEAINVPGIAVGEQDGHVTMSHLYPSYVNKQADVYTWRLLPVEIGFTRTVSFSITIGDEANYAQMLQNVWRDAYARYGFADKRYAVSDVYETLIDAVDRSYSVSYVWGNIPQYMTNTDHYFPDSGFLYRNLELATLMLKEGRAREDAEMVENAWSVIEYQIGNDCLDTGIRAYVPTNSVYKRVLFDGLGSAVDLYLYLSESGTQDNADFSLDDLLFYIVDKAEKYKNETSAMALTFYVKLWKYGDQLGVDYAEEALRLLEKAYEDTEDYNGYYGGVESTNTLISVAEDYMILVRAFLDAYETDGQKKWLDKAVVLGDYLETYQMIQPFDLNLEGATGAEGYYLAFIGNERFQAHGYIYNNTQHGILDIANTSSVIDYYRLYQYTQDEHYLDFAQDKLYNSMLYINMGDKVGYMDDPVHSAGKGFMNEFVGNSTFRTGYAEAGIRGAAHDSNIAWNVWQIVSSLKWFEENCGGYLPGGAEEDLEHDLAQNRYATGESADPAHTAAKAVDGDLSTCWIPAQDNTMTIDLNEFCEVSAVSVTAAGEGASVKVSFSNDGVNFSEEQAVSFSGVQGSLQTGRLARYVRLRTENAVGLADVQVTGVPAFYGTISYDGTVVSADGSGAENCLDESNYTTAWNAGEASQERVLVLDLGGQAAIFQTAIKFADDANNVLTSGACGYTIEISDDQQTWTPYAENAGDTAGFVFVDEGYAEARYVRLTLRSSAWQNFTVSDFKVMGRLL